MERKNASDYPQELLDICGGSSIERGVEALLLGSRPGVHQHQRRTSLRAHVRQRRVA